MHLDYIVFSMFKILHIIKMYIIFFKKLKYRILILLLQSNSVKPGVRFREIGEVISRHASMSGFSVVIFNLLVL